MSDNTMQLKTEILPQNMGGELTWQGCLNVDIIEEGGYDIDLVAFNNNLRWHDVGTLAVITCNTTSII